MIESDTRVIGLHLPYILHWGYSRCHKQGIYWVFCKKGSRGNSYLSIISFSNIFLWRANTTRTRVRSLGTSAIFYPGLVTPLRIPLFPFNGPKSVYLHSTAYQLSLPILEASHQFNYSSAKWSCLPVRPLYFIYFC